MIFNIKVSNRLFNCQIKKFMAYTERETQYLMPTDAKKKKKQLLKYPFLEINSLLIKKKNKVQRFISTTMFFFLFLFLKTDRY
jgi:hypothetical protein